MRVWANHFWYSAEGIQVKDIRAKAGTVCVCLFVLILFKLISCKNGHENDMSFWVRALSVVSCNI